MSANNRHIRGGETTPRRRGRFRLSRRDTLKAMGTGLGMLALPELLEAAGPNPLAPKPPHFKARAKRVIHIYLNGGPSQVDTWDPKPELSKSGITRK